MESLIERLGIKPDMQVCVMGLNDEAFFTELEELPVELNIGSPQKNSDLIFLRIHDKDGLYALHALTTFLKSDGAVWILWDKGWKSLNETHIRDAAMEDGFVDDKVERFSFKLSAMKLIFPVDMRA